jgi:hypothetical protein
MKIRIRNKWRDRNQARSMEDNAVALAYAAWQIALTAAKNIHAEDFRYEDDRQRTAVIAEYLYFLVHVADRVAHQGMSDDDRRQFVTAMARETGRHYQRNLEDVFGRGDHAGRFMDTLNKRAQAYAETSYGADGPGYQMRRVLGEAIQEVMGMDQVNRWVIQQVMDLDAPEAARHLVTAMENLFGTAKMDVSGSPHGVVGPD